MAGYQPDRERGRERPDRHRGQGRGAYTGEDQSWATRPPPAGTRRGGGRPAGGYGYGEGGYGYGEGRGRAGTGYAGGYGDEPDGYPAARYGDGYGYGPPARYREQSRPHRRDTTGGAEGNERLTAITGASLLVLLAAEGFTILSVHRLLTLHFFIGMLLVGPVLLKAGSTLYRFTRYYAGEPSYRRKGPPAPLLRLLGPFVLLLSLAVVGTGVMLAFTGPAGQIWIFLHKATFVLWFGAMSIHVLVYIWRLPHLIRGDLASQAGARAREVLAGRPARWLLLTASILGGLALAVATVHLSSAWAGFAGGG